MATTSRLQHASAGSSVGRVLVTGFEPFDGHVLNVSWEVARALDGRLIATDRASRSFQVIAAQVPCCFGRCIEEINRLIDALAPDLVIALGQAEGRADITIERVALNVRDARIADNDGCQPIDEPVNPTGPYAYPSGLPVRAMLRSLQTDGHPVALSNSAGTFVCNDLFYGLMHRLSRETLRGGFIHLPILPEQRRSERERSADRDDAPRGFSAQTPALPLETQVAALEAAIACALAQSSVSQEKLS